MTKSFKIVIGICAGIGTAVVLAVLFVFNPAQCAFYPECQFYKMTGLLCPGCGGLRATHELLHGQIALAYDFNPLFVSALPLLGVWLARGLVKKSRNEAGAFDVPPFWLWLAFAVVLLFGVLRNLPFSPFPKMPS